MPTHPQSTPAVTTADPHDLLHAAGMVVDGDYLRFPQDIAPRQTDAYKRGLADGSSPKRHELRDSMLRKTSMPEGHWMRDYALGWLKAQSVFSGGCQ